MAGNGGMAGGSMDGAANGGHPQGTEYTLQGVMRFLQTEWHRHERDRNAWEIERAEMKSRIGKLEGDARTSKRKHESLGKHVRLLETALKTEREKSQKLAAGEKTDIGIDPKEVARNNLLNLGKRSESSTGIENQASEEASNVVGRHETERDKSRLYLGKCAQEVAYHIIPGSHPQPEINEQELMNHEYQNHPMQRYAMDDGYMQESQSQQRQPPPQQMAAQQYQQQQRFPDPKSQYFHEQVSGLNQAGPKQSQANHVKMSREPSGLQPMYNDTSGHLAQGGEPGQGTATQREHADPKSFGNPRTRETEAGNVSFDFHSPPTDAAPADDKPLDSSRKQEFGQSTGNEDILVDEADGWNFDELPGNEPPSAPPTRRPDTDAFPNANFAPKSPTRGRGSHRRKSSGARRRSEGNTDSRELSGSSGPKSDAGNFKVRFALRGHLDVIRSVIFTGGGSPSEPEICTCGDDGTIKRWIIPATFGGYGPNSAQSSNDLDVTSYFTHRGHNGAVTSLAACPPAQNFSSGGRAMGDGWIFSGGQDASIKVWERGRVDPKATLDGHTDAVWALCVLPGTAGTVLGDRCSSYGGPDRILLASGGADGRILIWGVSPPPQLSSPQASSRRGTTGSRRANSISSGSNFPTSPQPSTATATPFNFTLIHHIVRNDYPSPTCISPLSLAGVNFVVSYTDASILVYDTRTGEEIVGMASLETYDGTRSTGVNSVVASTIGFDGTSGLDPNRALAEEESVVHGATGSSGGVEGVVISGYEDRYIRFFDANSGQCTYTMLAHPSAISSISQSPDGRELVSAGHDASLRFWSLEKRSCTQEITSHRLMRGEGVCSVMWSQDGRFVASGGGDGVVKVFSR
ncbi:hypothetical protein FQN57_006758 [Myotisia sp. PD_48]|nr:hypothetical protein FQN57_006758 [Myotisia sp. PD_48]